MQIDASDRTPRTLTGRAGRIQRNQKRGLMVVLGDPRSDDSDHARVPVRVGQYERGLIGPLGMRLHLLLSPALKIFRSTDCRLLFS